MPEILEKGESSSEEEQYNNLAKLANKEILDKIGYGFGSQQFINILFLQTGASYFLVGIVNALRVVFGNLAYSLLENIKNIKFSKKLVSLSGIFFGFSFLLMAFSIFINSAELFAFSIMINSIFIIFYGESKNLFKLSSSKAFLIEKLTKYSLIITAISLFLAAFIMDAFPISGEKVILNLFNNMLQFKIYGYLIVFEIAAIAFILAGYILSHVKSEAVVLKKVEIKNNYKYFLSNKILLLLILASVVVSITQTIGYSYYGIFIYQKFTNEMFGGFLNVAMVFLMSVFTSLIGYFVIKINAKVYKKFPILIFGILMLAAMPLMYYLNFDLAYLTIGTMLGVIGSSAIGVTSSLLAIELISSELRQAYFSFTNLISVPFLLVFVPLLAYVAQIYSLHILFLMLTIVLGSLAVLVFAASVIFRKELE